MAMSVFSWASRPARLAGQPRRANSAYSSGCSASDDSALTSASRSASLPMKRAGSSANRARCSALRLIRRSSDSAVRRSHAASILSAAAGPAPSAPST